MVFGAAMGEVARRRKSLEARIRRCLARSMLDRTVKHHALITNTPWEWLTEHMEKHGKPWERGVGCPYTPRII